MRQCRGIPGVQVQPVLDTMPDVVSVQAQLASASAATTANAMELGLSVNN